MQYLKFFSFLFLPMLALMVFGEMNAIKFIVDVLFVLAVVVIILGLNSQSWTQLFVKFLVTVYYLLVLFFAFIETMIFRFAGHGYNAEVFYHLSWESFDIGLAQYGVYLLALVLLMVVIIVVLFYLSRRIKSLRLWHVISGLAILMLLSPYTAVGRFVDGWLAFNNQQSDLSVVDNDIIDSLLDRGFINAKQVPVKQLITAAAPIKKNLVLVYLESFNQFFLDTPPYNELTPGLQALSQRHQSFGHENSAYVTIEGIVSSMCGTLLTMRSGNDSFMEGSSYLANLPCLSDVLNKAGYEQYYLGGAVMEFAGKGHFLTSHGYDHVRGMEYWLDQGMNSEKSFWGLSDADLFDEAVKTIEHAHKESRPFNLTLLTLGTHIPGFLYHGCEPLKAGEDQFLAAVRCTDYLVSKFVQKLESKQLLDNTLLVVVADHGIFPNPNMKSLFGDLVYDRRLVGITNHSMAIPNQALASYDLAPTILDWLDIKHNVDFLFGKSLEEPSHGQHKHLTRYGDWQKGNLEKNSHYACGENPKPDLLSRCEKENVFNWAQWIQSKYNDINDKPTIGCLIDVKVDFSDKNRVVKINGQNYYDKFYYSGYHLSTRDYKEGWFLFDIDMQMKLDKLTYLPLDEKSSDVVENHKNQKSNGFGVYVNVQDTGRPVVINYFDSNGWHEVENEPNMKMELDFCR